MAIFKFRFLIAVAAAASSARDTAVHARADGSVAVQYATSSGVGDGHERISPASLPRREGTTLRNSWFPLYTTSPTVVATDGPTTGQTSSPTVSVGAGTLAPSGKPTAGATTSAPSGRPSSRPTTATPSKMPMTGPPTNKPTGKPTTGAPSPSPTRMPVTTLFPTNNPTTKPPSSEPTVNPSSKPTTIPSSEPTTLSPTVKPTLNPSKQPSSKPTTMSPTLRPSPKPTLKPTAKPTNPPSVMPTQHPVTDSPSRVPTNLPSPPPSANPSNKPTNVPTRNPTWEPSPLPTRLPSPGPTSPPTKMPSRRPSFPPTNVPTRNPTREPSALPTRLPSPGPTSPPTKLPSRRPSFPPTNVPTRNPTREPSALPTRLPSPGPTSKPSFSPSVRPTVQPTPPPSSAPSRQPTLEPSTAEPSRHPASDPTPGPTTAAPTHSPSKHPATDGPTVPPTADLSNSPSYFPTTTVPTYSPIATTAPSQSPVRSYATVKSSLAFKLPLAELMDGFDVETFEGVVADFLADRLDTRKNITFDEYEAAVVSQTLAKSTQNGTMPAPRRLRSLQEGDGEIFLTVDTRVTARATPSELASDFPFMFVAHKVVSRNYVAFFEMLTESGSDLFEDLRIDSLENVGLDSNVGSSRSLAVGSSLAGLVMLLSMVVLFFVMRRRREASKVTEMGPRATEGAGGRLPNLFTTSEDLDLSSLDESYMDVGNQDMNKYPNNIPHNSAAESTASRNELDKWSMPDTFQKNRDKKVERPFGNLEGAPHSEMTDSDESDDSIKTEKKPDEIVSEASAPDVDADAEVGDPVAQDDPTPVDLLVSLKQAEAELDAIKEDPETPSPLPPSRAFRMFSCFNDSTLPVNEESDIAMPVTSNEKADAREYHVTCPSGPLGIIIDSSGHGPYVHEIKPHSPLLNLVEVGDLITKVDGVDTSGKDALYLANLISRKPRDQDQVISLLSMQDQEEQHVDHVAPAPVDSIDFMDDEISV